MILLHMGQAVAKGLGFCLFSVCFWSALAQHEQALDELFGLLWGGWQVSLAAAELSPGALRGAAPQCSSALFQLDH